MTDRKFSAVVFDMDGVILDSESLVVECWYTIAERHQIPDMDQVCRACIGTSETKYREIMLEWYGGDFPYEEYRAEMSELFQKRFFEDSIPMKPGVNELLEYLKNQNIKIALASSTKEAIVRHELQSAGILSYFQKIICGDMVQKSKPEPDIYLKACQALGIAPEEAYAIEDSCNGIRSASSAGLRTVMVPDMIKPTAEMEELTEIILPSLMEVQEYLHLKLKQD